jgi:hypothetical protein
LPPTETGADAPGFEPCATRSTIVRPHVLSVSASQQNSPIDAVCANELAVSRWVYIFDPTTTAGPLMSVVPNGTDFG